MSLFKGRLNNKHGILKSDYSALLFPIEYESIKNEVANLKGSYHKGKLIQLKKDDKVGLIDQNGIEVLPLEYQSIQTGSSSIIIQKNNKYGLLDNDGNEILPLEYQTIQFENYGIMLQKDNLWGLIDYSNNTIFKTEYDKITQTVKYEKFFILEKDNQDGLWDSETKKWIIPFSEDSFEVISKYKILVQKNNKWGIIQPSEGVIVPIKYDEIKKHKGRIGNKWETLPYFKKTQDNIDRRNKIIKKPGNESEEKYGVMGWNGNWLLPPKYEQIRKKGDYYQIIQDGKMGLVDLEDDFIIETQYDKVVYYPEDNYIKAQQDGKWGMISKENEIIFPFKYEYAN